MMNCSKTVTQGTVPRVIIFALIGLFCSMLISCSSKPVADNSDISNPSSSESPPISSNVTVRGEYDINGAAEKKYFTQLKEAAELGDTVVSAYINGEPLYLREVIAHRANYNLNIDKYVELYPNVGEDDPYLKKYRKTDDELFHICIIRKIISMEAEREGITVDEDIFRAQYFRNYRLQEEESPEWLSALAQAQGLTLGEYKEAAADAYVNNAKVDEYIENRFPISKYKNIEARDNAVTEYIDNMIGKEYKVVIVE